MRRGLARAARGGTTPRGSTAAGVGAGKPPPPSPNTGGARKTRSPFTTLRFKPDQPVWGFNVERQIKRRQEIDRWTAARQNVWISNLTEAGQLDGLDGVRQGLGLDIRPYGSAAVADGSTDATAGVDLF